MKKKILIIYLFLNFFLPLEAALKEEIISNLKKTNNLTFNFKQTINQKTEKGNCVIEYPKKIFCLYNNSKKKILISDGKMLVIKNQESNLGYIYPLNKTPLDLILNKNYLISQIEKLEGRIIDKKYLNFTLKNNDNKINIFFDNQTLNLIGWQTEDIYQNLVITFISEIKINQKIDKNIFKLPQTN
jgi:outer membrane lipoprotein-sorting protein